MIFIKKIKNFFKKDGADNLGTDAPVGRWAVGIYTGISPFDLSSPASITNPVLTADDVTDMAAGFVADPFMLRENSTWYMFFEVLNSRDNLGKIGLAVSKDGFHWRYEKIVLSEAFSLSYPYIFKSGKEYYLIPESNSVKSVRLYKATDFPVKWRLEKTLLTGQRFSDASVFHCNEQWWMFTATRSRPENNGKLRLYYADKLEGRWAEHPKSPVVKYNPHIARPGGRVLVLRDEIIRYAQDDFPDYGKQVRAFRITKLTRNDYEEIPHNCPIIGASGTGWNQFGMHTVDPHPLGENEWIACVDGLGIDD